MKFSSLVNVQIENRRIDWVYFLRQNIHDNSNKVRKNWKNFSEN